MAETVLAIVAHPDDETFWMGGTLAKFAKAGKDVGVVTVADGTCGRPVSRDEQFSKACEALGVAGRIGRLFPDQLADRVSQLEINMFVDEVVTRMGPSLVLTHYHSDLNIDHRRVCEAVLVATRDVCPVWMCQPEFPERVVGPRWAPNREELIRDVLEVKQRACACYPEELARRPSRRTADLMYESFVEVA